MVFAVEENEEANKQEDADPGGNADANTKDCLVAAKAKASEGNSRRYFCLNNIVCKPEVSLSSEKDLEIFALRALRSVAVGN